MIPKNNDRSRKSILLLVCIFATLSMDAIAATVLARLATATITLTQLFCPAEGNAWYSIFGSEDIEEKAYGMSLFGEEEALVVGSESVANTGNTNVLFNLYNTTTGDLLEAKTMDGLTSQAGYQCIYTDDNAFVCVGEVYVNPLNGVDILVVKVNKLLTQVIWSFSIGDVGKEIGLAVQQTPDGGYAIVGCTTSYNTFQDPFILKIDAQGQIAWQKFIPGIYQDIFYDLEVTADELIIVGFTESHAVADRDVLLAKFAFNGTLTWISGVSSLNEVAHTIVANNDGSFAIGGCIFNRYHAQMLLLFDASNTLTSAKVFGSGRQECNSAIIKTLDGYAIAGSSPRTGGKKYDLSLALFTNEGNITSFTITGESTNDDKGKALAITSEGNILVAGYQTKEHGQGDTNIHVVSFPKNINDHCGTILNVPPLDIQEESEVYDIEPVVLDSNFIVTDLTNTLVLHTISAPFDISTCT